MKRNLIINFHVVNDPEWFERVILLLRSKYSLVELSFFENIDNYKKKKGFCHITFDDGDKTFYTVAYPILKKHNVPATIFVSPKIIMEHVNFWFQEVRGYDKNVMNAIFAKELSLPLAKISKTGFINILKRLPVTHINKFIELYRKETNTPLKPFQNMNLVQILEVEKSGLVTIGAHTLNHPILKNENNEVCYREITESIIGLQELIGRKIKYFAYPNGIPNKDFGDREIEIVRKSNILIAVSGEQKFISKDDNLLAFPRIGISYGSMRFIRLKLTMGTKWGILKKLFIKIRKILYD